MFRITTELMLVIALMLTLKEYRKMCKQNEEVSGILKDMIKSRNKLNDECRELFELTKKSLIESRRAIVIGGNIITKNNILIDKYDVYKEEIEKYKNILNRTKKPRVKKKIVKRILE
ncbi:hypothetical protein ACQPUL_08370 [Clostridium butyricum]|uniref:hypothetical protein n=1 Tax=Clostridium butyricum TaxID=1492 RepID=UPI003D351148